MAKNALSADRRHFLAAGLASVVAVGAAPYALSAQTTKSSHYYTELEAIDRETARLNAVSVDEAEWARWEKWTNRVWSEIEALPPTPENAKLKARAVWSIISGDVEDIDSGQSTCGRMVRQVIIGLSAGVN